MFALIFVAAALICAIAALFCHTVPTEPELEDDERLRAFLWLPTPLIMLIASFYAVKRFDGSLPKLSPFLILMLSCLGFTILALIAFVASGIGAPHK
jgi:hypothetical protein